MAAKYIPPGRRNPGEARGQWSNEATSETSPGVLKPTGDIYPKSYLAEDIYDYFGLSKDIWQYNNTTLHASASSPDSLAYVLLFPGANPRWATDQILFVKSNLDLIRTDLGDSSEASATQKLPDSVAIFEQTGRSQLARFAFVGWYKVTNVQFLSPRTEEVVRMLEQKWTKKDRLGNVSAIEREGDAWIRSLNHRWAVVKFERDEEAEKEKGGLDIPERSVNELLQEMRLGKRVAAGKEGAIASDSAPNITPVLEEDPNVLADNPEVPAPKGVSPTEVIEGQSGCSSTEDTTGRL